MIKAYITAVFLSQALMQGVTNELDFYTRRVNIIHVGCSTDCTMVVPADDWATPKAPVPYYQYWNCEWRQTAQQCVAIYSLLQQELEK